MKKLLIALTILVMVMSVLVNGTAEVEYQHMWKDDWNSVTYYKELNIDYDIWTTASYEEHDGYGVLRSEFKSVSHNATGDMILEFNVEDMSIIGYWLSVEEYYTSDNRMSWYDVGDVSDESMTETDAEFAEWMEAHGIGGYRTDISVEDMRTFEE